MYKKIEKENYNIHIINNNKFHTIIFSISFTENVTYEKVTYRNTLVNILLKSCKLYNTKRIIRNKALDLFSIFPRARVIRHGNLIETNFTLSITSSIYIDKNIIKDNIDYLWEILLNPNVVDNEFNKEELDICIKEESLDNTSLHENNEAYAHVKANILAANNTNIGISNYSDINILQTINTKNLYDSYQEMINNSKIDIFLSGNISNGDEVVNYISNKFKFNNHYKLNNPFIIHNNDSVKSYKENRNIRQSILTIIMKTYNLTDFESFYVLPIYKNILGGDNNSLLVDRVREENSLAYYISVFESKLDNDIEINSGIAGKNYEEVINLINKSLLDIKNGKFTLKNLSIAKAEYLNSLDNAFEQNDNYIRYYYGKELFNSETIEKRKENILKVTKEDIIKFSDKVKISTIFLLEGEL